MKTESLPLLQKFPRKVRAWSNIESFCILSSDKFITVVILVHNFWSQGSIDTLELFTDCTVFDRLLLCLRCSHMFAYFDESMGSIGGMNHGKVGIQ